MSARDGNEIALDHEEIVFISDVHLASADREAEARKVPLFLSFLDFVASSADALVICGDLFDFWFEFGSAIQKTGFRVLARLERLASSGTRIYFIGGNHDYWVHDFLTTEVGVTVLPSGARTVQGRRVFLAHGDGLARGDWGYRVFKTVTRNRFVIGAIRLVHPDLLLPLAANLSHTSRKMTSGWEDDPERLYREIALPEFARGADAVLVGHYHCPTHFSREGKDFVIIGDWVQHASYVRLRNRSFELHDYGEEAAKRPSSSTSNLAAS